MIWTMLQVALGGALGAVSRYLTGVAALRVFGASFPIGTLSVNILGSFLMGIAFVVLVARGGDASRLVPFIMTGFLGGFTTFSAFSLDAFALLEKGRTLAAVIYIGGSVGLSIFALILGVVVAKGMTG